MATKADLQKALDAANADRPEDDQIVPGGSTKADLEKALADAGVEVEDSSSDESPADAEYVLVHTIQVKTKGNGVRHMNAGDLVTDDVSDESREHLRSLGYIGALNN